MTSSGSKLDTLGQAFQAFEWKEKEHHFLPNVNLPSPTPGLRVNGVGLLDMPLKETQAQAIVSTYAPPSAANAPPVPVDIPPGKTSLTKEWGTFVIQLIERTALPEIGVNTPIAMPLVRVTLHQPGTSTPLGYEKYDDGNMIASVSIVLPSQYTGGQIKLPNGKDKPPIIYDPSRSTASVLAWYTPIPTSVEPVTSGYRLTLTYGILYVGIGRKPSLPNPAAIAQSVRAALQSWLNDSSKSSSSEAKIPLLAYALPGGATDAHKGVGGLTPRNSFVAELVLPIAQSLGLSVYLARLDKTLVGLPHQEHFAHACIPRARRGKEGFSRRFSGVIPLDIMLSLGSMLDEDYEPPAKVREDYLYGDYDTPDMGEIEREEQKLSQLTALNGAKELDLDEFQVAEENIVQTGTFYEAKPQHNDFDRDSGEVIQKFVRSALVFIRPAEHTNIVSGVMGPYASLKELPISNTSTKFAQMVISASLEKLAQDGQSHSVIGSLWDSEARRSSGVNALRILAHAIAWNDHFLWNKAIRYCKDCDESDCVASIANGLKMFKADSVKEGIMTLIKETPSLSRSFCLMNAVSSNDASGNSGPWLAELKTAALSACNKPTVADVSAVVSIAHTNGPASILPFVTGMDKTGTYDVLIALAKALHEQTKSAALSNEHRVVYEEAVRECISAAVPQWESSHEHCGWKFRNEGDTHENPLTKRICDLILFCCAINYVQPCADLFDALFHFKLDIKAKDISTRLKNLHAPVCFHFNAAMAKQGKSTMQEPFLSLYRNTISIYLDRVLGAKPILPALPSKAVGCGCADCTELDKFLRNNKKMFSFQATQSRRTHLESQIRKEKAFLANYVTTDTDKWEKPHTLKVRKSREVAAALAWGDTKAKAEAFIKCICGPDEATLRTVMGSRYEDAVNALNGTKAFAAGPLSIPGVKPSIRTKRKRD